MHNILVCAAGRRVGQRNFAHRLSVASRQFPNGLELVTVTKSHITQGPIEVRYLHRHHFGDPLPRPSRRCEGCIGALASQRTYDMQRPGRASIEPALDGERALMRIIG